MTYSQLKKNEKLKKEIGKLQNKIVTGEKKNFNSTGWKIFKFIFAFIFIAVLFSAVIYVLSLLCSTLTSTIIFIVCVSLFYVISVWDQISVSESADSYNKKIIGKIKKLQSKIIE